MADFKKEVEAVLFAAGRLVEIKELQKLLHMKDPGLIKETIRELKDDYEARESPLMIIAEGEGDEITGWKLTVKEKMLPLVQKVNPHTELNKSILETLAVITWKQPIVQSDVIKIRTNKAYEHISELERMGFIAKKKFGRSYSITVTQKFLDYFDLPDTESIKDVFKDFKDVEVAVQKKKDDLENAPPEDTAEDKTETEEAPAPEQSPGGPLEGEGVELEPYIDVLPEGTKPKHENEVEVYERDEEDIARDMMNEDLETKEEETEEDDQAEAEEAEHEETPEEKAKRLAEELIKDEKEAEEEEAERERQLHPALEEFIEGSVEHISAKGEEDHSEEIEEKPEVEEGEEVEESEEHDSEEKHEESEKEKEAEEFPGQFDGQTEQEEGEESEEPEKENA